MVGVPASECDQQRNYRRICESEISHPPAHAISLAICVCRLSALFSVVGAGNICMLILSKDWKFRENNRLFLCFDSCSPQPGFKMVNSCIRSADFVKIDLRRALLERESANNARRIVFGLFFCYWSQRG
jgi:hypothetical protein